MYDCLPQADDWSPKSQFLMLQEHLEAMRHHLEVLETASAQNAWQTVQEAPHLQELNQRCLEAHDLLQALARQPETLLKSLQSEAQ